MLEKSFKKSPTTACLAIALAALVVPLSAPASADVSVSAPKTFGIVVDGQVGDWANVPGTTLTMIRPNATSERLENALTIKVAYDDAYIYVLATVVDDYDYNATDHDLSPALAVLWRIDAAARVDMGGGRGNVDIWHWELDCGAGVQSGFYLRSGNDPACNLDDEWASSPTKRKDDNQSNELYGVWAHSNMAAPGAAGAWIFEMKRSLRTGDTLNQDRQFNMSEAQGLSIAYWDADETVAGWTPEGHYTTCEDPATLDFSWINVTFAPLPLETELAATQAELAASEETLEATQADLAAARSELAATRLTLNATQAAQAAQATLQGSQQTKIDSAAASASTATMFGLLGVILGAAAIGLGFMMGRKKGPSPQAPPASPPKEGEKPKDW